MEHKDALGDPIIIGKKYGYSYRGQNLQTLLTVTGLAKDFGTEGVSLTVLSAEQVYITGTRTQFEYPETANISGYRLFPVKDKFDKTYDSLVAKLRTEFPEISIEEIDHAIESWCQNKMKSIQIDAFQEKE